ncbi:hypothetical protein JCM6882_005989 [Rhodosporidiobolus microsporus]
MASRSSLSSLRLLLLGATGATGSHALRAALESPAIGAVLSFGRTAPKVDGGVAIDKLQHMALDFEALLQEDGKGAEAAKLREAKADVVVIALGSTRQSAGSFKNFERIDREYVVAAARAARREDKPEQRLVYLSSGGSSSSSWFPYTRSKGLTEEQLVSLDYAETIIFRPSMLVIPGGRSDSRLVESILGSITNAFSSFTNALQIATPILGKSLVQAATLSPSALRVPSFGREDTLVGKPLWAVWNAQALALGGATTAKKFQSGSFNMTSTSPTAPPAAKEGTSGGSAPATARRSRAGCTTCRQRKKKCDETRLPQHNGACERCFLASYKCEWPVPGQRPVRKFEKGAGRTQRQTLDRLEAPYPSAPAGGAATVPPFSSATPAAPVAGPSTVRLPPSALQQPALTSLAPSAPAPVPCSFPIAASSGPSYPAAPSSAFPFDFSLPSSSLFGAALDPFSSIPGLMNDTDFNQFFASLDPEFGNLASGSLDTPTLNGSPANGFGSGTVAGGAGEGGEGASVLAAVGKMLGTTETDEGVIEQVDPLYDEFNKEFFSSLPKPVRDVVCSKIFNLASSTVSNRSSAMAIVMLFRLRQVQSQRNSDDPALAAAAAEQEGQLLLASTSYFNKALEHLEVTDIPLEAKMLAAYDLLGFQFERFGASACHAIRLLCESFITEALGPQPVLRFHPMTHTTDIAVVCYAWSDILRHLYEPKRRPLYSFSSLPGDSASLISTTPWQPPPSAIQYHRGLPFALLLCIAAIGQLEFEKDALPDEMVKIKADYIEKTIREWVPGSPDVNELADASAYLDKVGSAEMWRHACIIFLHQAIHQHGPLHPVISSSARSILSVGAKLLRSSTATTSILGDAPTPGTSGSTPKTPTGYLVGGNGTGSPSYSFWRDAPWFIAGTVVSLPRDRELCRRGLKECGTHYRAYHDDVQALSMIWAEEDRNGWPIQWRTWLQKQRVYVEFM